MSELKKGDRVRNEKGKRGTVDSEVFYQAGIAAVFVRMDEETGCRTLKYLHNLTKIANAAPLRFEDVRDGDTITVEGIDYSTTGTARKPDNPACVTVGGVTVFNFDGDEGTHGPYGPPVYLTAHTPAPAEPEWHRAKVIKADNEDMSSVGYYVRNAEDPRFFTAPDGCQWNRDALTNVTIIVDECGQVRA